MPTLANLAEAEWRQGLTGGHRGQGGTATVLLEGDPGSPNNYVMIISRSGEKLGFSPRHRHDFEQIRFPLHGSHSYAPQRDVPEGWVGYFPEGVRYGPFNQHADTEYMLIQFGGPSGNGFLPYQQWREIGDRLAERGRFEKGIFRYEDGDGKTHNQDALEAILEEARSRPVVYPEGRYLEPVVLNPQAYEWLPVEGAEGVSERRLATFNECGTCVSEVQLAPGSSYAVPPDPRIRLCFVAKGELTVGGTRLANHSAFAVHADEADVEIACAPGAAESAEVLISFMPKLAGSKP